MFCRSSRLHKWAQCLIFGGVRILLDRQNLYKFSNGPKIVQFVFLIYKDGISIIFSCVISINFENISGSRKNICLSHWYRIEFWLQNQLSKNIFIILTLCFDFIGISIIS